MRRKLALFLLAATLVPAFGVAACGGEPEEQAREDQGREETTQEEQVEEEAREELRQKQQAGYYGEEFAGVPTASGEPYDPEGFTAAHPYLPFGTKLAVSYQGRSVTVRINDRIPYGGDYELDLSWAAAQDIGITDVGTAVVDVEVLET